METEVGAARDEDGSWEAVVTATEPATMVKNYAISGTL